MLLVKINMLTTLKSRNLDNAGGYAWNKHTALTGEDERSTLFQLPINSVL